MLSLHWFLGATSKPFDPAKLLLPPWQTVAPATALHLHLHPLQWPCTMVAVVTRPLPPSQLPVPRQNHRTHLPCTSSPYAAWVAACRSVFSHHFVCTNLPHFFLHTGACRQPPLPVNCGKSASWRTCRASIQTQNCSLVNEAPRHRSQSPLMPAQTLLEL